MGDVFAKSLKLLRKAILLCFLVFVPVFVMAADEEDRERKVNWVEKSRRYIGATAENVGRAMDGLLSGDWSKAENDSYVRLRLGRTYEEQGVDYLSSSFKFKVDIPKSRDRWQLVFETSPEDQESLEETSSDLDGSDENVDDADENATGALRFISRDWHNWDTNFDLGVRLPFPVEWFTKFQIEREFYLGNDWRHRMIHSVYYYRYDGFGQDSKYYFDRPLSDDWHFTQLFEHRWQDEGSLVEYALISSFRHVYSHRDLFIYRLGSVYQDNPGNFLDSYFVDFKYRRLLYSDWLYAEVIPRAQWSRDIHYNDESSITFRLEVYFKSY